MFIVRFHLSRRNRTIKSYPPSAIDFSQYNGFEKFLTQTMFKLPCALFRPIIIILNQVLIEILLVMEYALGFSFFLRRNSQIMEKAYFIDNVYDSRESIKVFVESVLNLGAQSVIYYLGG